MEIFWYIYNFRRFFFDIFRQFTVLTISSSVFIQIIWFLARFEGNLKYYQRPVRTEVNRSFCGLSISKVKDQDCWSGLFRSFSGPVSRPDLQVLGTNDETPFHRLCPRLKTRLWRVLSPVLPSRISSYKLNDHFTGVELLVCEVRHAWEPKKICISIIKYVNWQ